MLLSSPQWSLLQTLPREDRWLWKVWSGGKEIERERRRIFKSCPPWFLGFQTPGLKKEEVLRHIQGLIDASIEAYELQDLAFTFHSQTGLLTGALWHWLKTIEAPTERYYQMLCWTDYLRGTIEKAGEILEPEWNMGPEGEEFLALAMGPRGDEVRGAKDLGTQDATFFHHLTLTQRSQIIELPTTTKATCLLELFRVERQRELLRRGGTFQ